MSRFLDDINKLEIKVFNLQKEIDELKDLNKEKQSLLEQIKLYEEIINKTKCCGNCNYEYNCKPGCIEPELKYWKLRE